VAFLLALALAAELSVELPELLELELDRELDPELELFDELDPEDEWELLDELLLLLPLSLVDESLPVFFFFSFSRPLSFLFSLSDASLSESLPLLFSCLLRAIFLSTITNYS